MTYEDILGNDMEAIKSMVKHISYYDAYVDSDGCTCHHFTAPNGWFFETKSMSDYFSSTEYVTVYTRNKEKKIMDFSYSISDDVWLEVIRPVKEEIKKITRCDDELAVAGMECLYAGYLRQKVYTEKTENG